MGTCSERLSRAPRASLFGSWFTRVYDSGLNNSNRGLGFYAIITIRNPTIVLAII